MVKIDGEDKGTVGPGPAVERPFNIPHGGVHTVEIEERAATEAEVEALKAGQAAI
jgi:hypothetical protein